MSATEALRLYPGRVVHRRRIKPGTSFRYRVFTVLADIDRLDEAAQARRFFSHNRFNLVSVYDCDHGAKDGSPLRPWIDARLADAGLDLEGGRVYLNCYPRVLGYVFNPLTLWWCYGADGRPLAVLCEVRNTFGEWHGYLVHRDGEPMPSSVTGRAAKVFHVSPLLPLGGRYGFRFRDPDERIATTVNFYREADDRQPALTAVQTGRLRAATDAGLLRTALSQPLMTRKVIAAIHWHALHLWLRGARIHRKPPPPSREISQ